jgi:hypothetical protein
VQVEDRLPDLELAEQLAELAVRPALQLVAGFPALGLFGDQGAAEAHFVLAELGVEAFDGTHLVLGRLRLADERGEAVSYAIQRLFLCELELRAGAWATAERLLAAQAADGRWPGGPKLRLTRHETPQPWATADSGVLYADTAGLFTTATVVGALQALHDRLIAESATNRPDPA